jgi:TfoX/Sxy family transcriptional regulator of competence genes
MATWQKSPQSLIDTFTAALPADDPRVQRRQMFGYPCAFVNGHMAVGLHEHRLIARVPDAAQAHPCVILGRHMKQYAALEQAQALAPAEVARWVRRAIEFTATMPPKAAKASKASAPKRPGSKRAA